ncbi:MAG TPA: DNA-directed RNA polymerase subunit alpha C-terminal domain-containing protein [Phycisphaerae bacterium]|nr:DNA-directed RNA polymerase subunit alpha C-terminal domain-containing protein [Phycisphaerae bacterium]
METILDFSSLLSHPTFDEEQYRALKEAAFSDDESVERFASAVRQLAERASGEGDALKLGMCYLLLGNTTAAHEWLEKARPGAQRDYYLGQVLRDSKRLEPAMAAFQSAAQAGWDRLECECQRAECLIAMGDLSAAAESLQRQAGAGERSAQWHYTKGRLQAEQGDIDAAIASYEKAISLNPDHVYSLFHLAYLLDLHGSDDRAMELYQRCTELPYIHSHALINLAVIHEDRCEYDKAAECLQGVLDVNPNHARAQLYMKDVMAAEDMYIDEQQMKLQEKHDAVLDIPVTDFELSVRSRNCLKKMNINTLGDLLRTTEAELLAYKNFGDTSLREIKAMLLQKGLSLGQNAPEKAEPVEVAPEAAAPEGGDPEVYSKSVATMELSVRSRKCLQRLGINTIGELVSRSEQELLASRNFGATSLKEIKDRLVEMGVSLKNS